MSHDLCARPGCGAPTDTADASRRYCSEECAAWAFALRHGMPDTVRWAQEKIAASRSKSIEASERFKEMHAKLTPEERSERGRRAAQLKKEKAEVR